MTALYEAFHLSDFSRLCIARGIGEEHIVVAAKVTTLWGPREDRICLYCGLRDTFIREG